VGDRVFVCFIFSDVTGTGRRPEMKRRVLIIWNEKIMTEVVNNREEKASSRDEKFRRRKCEKISPRPSEVMREGNPSKSKHQMIGRESGASPKLDRENLRSSRGSIEIHE
jgi:tRNA A37 methylthiotransferase MiaB